MSFRLALCVFALPFSATIAQEARTQRQPVPPIAVVALNRKDPVSFEKDVEPILANKCQVCHSGSIKEGKLDLGSYEQMLKGGKRGPAIVPGKSAESLLVRLAGRTDKPIMPPRNEVPLTPEELALLKLWVDQGAKRPAGPRVRARVTLGILPPPVQPVRALAISHDKSVVASGRANQLHLYEPKAGSFVRSLVDADLKGPDQKPVRAAHLSIVESLAFSPDGTLLASGAYQEVSLWQVKTGTVARRLTGFADRVVTLSFSPDGKRLATGGGAPTEEGEIRVFEVASGKPIADIKNGHSDTVFGVCFSPDGTMLATCSADKFVKVFEVSSGKFLKAFEGHTHHVMDVGWKSDGKLLASAGADNAIKVWDFEKGEQVRSFGNHTKQVTRLAFKGKTSEVLTCSGDHMVRFWNVDNGSGGMAFGGNKDFLYAVAVSPDGAFVAAGGEEGVVRLYNGANGQLIKELLPPGVTPAKH